MRQMSHEHITSDTEHTQVSAMTPVHQVTLAELDDLGAKSHAPYIQQGQSQKETGEHPPIPDVGFVQIEPLAFQVPMGFLHPHAAAISLQGLALRVVGGGQKPRSLFSRFPMNQQVAAMTMLLGQEHIFIPGALGW